MNKNFRLFSCVSLALALGMATGCPGDDGGGTGSESADTGGTTGSGTDTTAGSMSTTTDGTSASTTASTTDDTATGSTTAPPEPQPNGAECSDNAECESEMCFVVGVLGGICGDCLTDADCPDGGCSLPNPLAQPPEGAECNMGELGGGCMSDDVCAAENPICAEILNVPGVLVANTCSTCNERADCTDQICNPTYNVLELSGHKTCVDPGTVGLGEGCTIGDEGNMACESMYCATADVMGLLQLGVCSECIEDGDCGMNEMCVPPEVDLATGLVAGTCEPV